MFFILAFGMILRWRTSMYLRYRALRAEVSKPSEDIVLEGARGRP
jgi:membrane protein CcdC involved in cytochrome C biogenesis